MKKVIILLFLIIKILFLISPSLAHSELFESEITLKSSYEECLKEENVEAETQNYLKIKPVYLNLSECIEIAILYNYYFRISQYANDIARWNYKNALSDFLPDIGLSGYSIYYSGQVLVGAALVDKFNELALSASAHIEHPLTNGGEHVFNSLSKKQLKFAARNDLNYTYNEILLNTTIAYYNLLQSKLDIEIYQKNYKERCAQLVQVLNLMKAGLGTQFDVIRSQTELAQARQNLLDSMQDFRLSQARLANIIGVEITTSIMPPEFEAKELELVSSDKTIENLFDEAKVKREDVRSIQAKIKSLKMQKRQIYSEFIPKARVFAQQQWQGTAQVGLGPASIVAGYLDINIGSNMGIGTYTKAKAKQAEIDKTILELEQKLRDIKENILKTFYEAKVSKDRIKISKEQVEYATQSVELAQLRQEAGVGILIDVIQAQTFKTRTKVELLNSIIRYNIAQVQMLFDSGNITKEAILDKYAP